MSDVLKIRLSSAVRIGEVDSRQDAIYRGGDFQTVFNAFQESTFDGAGPVLGGQMNWSLTRWLSLNFGANAGALLGTMRTRTFIPDDEPGVPTDVTYEEARLAPLLESRVWLSCCRQVGQFQVNFGGGYEFANLFNVADQRVFSDSHMEGQNAHLVGDVGLDGLFGRFSISR